MHPDIDIGRAVDKVELPQACSS